MYEAEVKAQLVESCFNPADGWSVVVHLDPMELCRGGTHPEGKKQATGVALQKLERLGTEIGVDHSFGVDIRAEHADSGLVLIEVKGRSSLQKEVALYSGLGQLLTKIGEPPWGAQMGLAFPGGQAWNRQAGKIPLWLRKKLDLSIYLVSEGEVEVSSCNA